MSASFLYATTPPIFDSACKQRHLNAVISQYFPGVFSLLFSLEKQTHSPYTHRERNLIGATEADHIKPSSLVTCLQQPVLKFKEEYKNGANIFHYSNPPVPTDC